MTTVKELTDKLKANDYDLTVCTDEECALFERLSVLKEHEGKLIRHFKGKVYLLLGVEEHTETHEILVSYRAMYGEYKRHARPIDMFLSEVDKVKYPEIEQKYRFDFVDSV